MNVGSVIFGMLIGIAVVIGAAVYMGPSLGAPTPADVCNEELPGDDWEPKDVATDSQNKSVQIICEMGNQTRSVTTDLDITDDLEKRVES